jgi:hypothetical protein
MAASICTYWTPSWAFGNGEVVVIIKGLCGGEMTSVNCWELLAPSKSLTEIVNVDGPAVVGVPLIWPAVLSMRPLGSVPVIKLHE